MLSRAHCFGEVFKGLEVTLLNELDRCLVLKMFVGRVEEDAGALLITGVKLHDRLTRDVEERCAPLADFDAMLTHERAISASVGGRTVFDDRMPCKSPLRNSAIAILQIWISNKADARA